MKRSTSGPNSNDSKNAPITADFHKTLGSNFEEQRKQFYRKYYSKFQSARFERSILLASPGSRRDLDLLVRYVNDEFDDESQVANFVCEMNEWNENKLENFLDALLPNIGRLLIHKWNDFAKWPTNERGAFVFRSPNNKVLVANRQLDCLWHLIAIRGCYPDHISESVTTLVRLGGLYGSGTTSINGYGLLSSSNGDQYAIGTLAASAIDGNGKESAEVLSLIREIWQRKNSSAGVAGWHLSQAFGRSNRGDLHDELVDRLVSQGCTFDSVRILRAGLDSSLEVMNRILPAAIKAGLHQHKSVRAAIIDAFLLSHPPVQKIPTLIEDCAAVLQKENVKSTQKWYALALEFWASAVADMDAAAKMFPSLQHDKSEEYRSTMISFCNSTIHEGLISSLRRSPLFSPSQQKVAKFVLTYSTRKNSPSETQARLHETIELLREYSLSKDKKAFLGRVSEELFIQRVASTLRDDWCHATLGLVEDLLDHPRLESLSFLPDEYCPPDERSTELVLGKLEPPDNVDTSFDHIAHHRFLGMLLRVPPSIALWESIFLHYSVATHQMHSRILEPVQNLPPLQFETILFRLLRHKLPRMRCSGLFLVLQSLGGCQSENLKALSDQILASIQEKTNEEIRLARLVRDSLRTEDSKPISIALTLFRSLIYTDPVEPKDASPIRITKELERFLSSLDRWIDKHEAEILSCLKRSERRYTNLGDARIFNGTRFSKTPDWQQPINQLLDDWFQSWSKNTESPDSAVLARAFTMQEEIYETDCSTWKDWKKRKMNLKGLIELDSQRIPYDSVKKGEGLTCLSQLKHWSFVRQAIEYLFNQFASWDDRRYFLEIAETLYARLPKEAVTNPSIESVNSEGRFRNVFSDVLKVQYWLYRATNDVLDEIPLPFLRRAWDLRRLTQFPHPLMGGGGLDEIDFVAFGRGVAQLGDLAKQLLDSGTVERPLTFRNVHCISKYSLQRSEEWESFSESLGTMIVQGELGRKGKPPAKLSYLIPHLQCLVGFNNFESVALATANSKLVRPSDSISNRIACLSTLIGNFFPKSTNDPTDVAQRLNGMLSSKVVTTQRLIEYGILAPQWLPQIDTALGWTGTREFLYWIILHGKHFSEPNGLYQGDVIGNKLGQHRLFCKESILENYPSMVAYRPSWFDSLYLTTDYFVEKQWLLDVLAPLNSTQIAAIRDGLHLLANTQIIESTWLLMDCILGKRTIKHVLESVNAATSEIDLRPVGLCKLAGGIRLKSDLKNRMDAMKAYRSRVSYDRDLSIEIRLEIESVRDMLAYYAEMDPHDSLFSIQENGDGIS